VNPERTGIEYDNSLPKMTTSAGKAFKQTLGFGPGKLMHGHDPSHGLFSPLPMARINIRHGHSLSTTFAL
jgi:hypothetical protein